MNKGSFINGLLKSSKGYSKLALRSSFGAKKGLSSLAKQIFVSPCYVCSQSTSDYNSRWVNINLDFPEELTTEFFCVCVKCLDETKNRIKEIEKIPEELPLYINHENIFIRGFVAEKLKSMEEL